MFQPPICDGRPYPTVPGLARQGQGDFPRRFAAVAAAILHHARGLPIACALALCFSSGCSVGPQVATGRDRTAGYDYRVAFTGDLRRADVLVCFGGAPPTELRASVGAAARYLLGAQRMRGDTASSALPVHDGVIDLGGVGPEDCVSYAVDLGTANGAQRPTAILVDDGALLSHALLFWGPPAAVNLGEVRVRFMVPAGWSVSTPLEPRGDAFIAHRDLFQFIGQMAITRQAPAVLDLGDVELTVVREPGELGISDDEVRAWLTDAVAAVRRVTGTFPVSRLQAIIVPVPVAKEPVAFGSVVRGGGNSVVLFVSRKATLASLRADWVAVHEMSHLLLPFVSQAWLGEGMATYYQEVVRARAGVQTELEAWRTVDRGFSRGRDDITGGTLEEESRDMGKSHSYRRVYWSGAALALSMDVALRRQGKSLDGIIGAFRQQPGDMGRTWDAMTLVRAWDALAGATAGLEVICQAALASAQFVDLGDVYKYLGITRNRFGEVTLDDAAEGAAVRRAIMGVPESEPVPATEPVRPTLQRWR